MNPDSEAELKRLSANLAQKQTELIFIIASYVCVLVAIWTLAVYFFDLTRGTFLFFAGLFGCLRWEILSQRRKRRRNPAPPDSYHPTH